MPHGRAFIVKKPKVFTTNILPRFFKQTKYLSFTRQVNLWGFKRITRGADCGAYYHELFLRGRPYLGMRMRRQKIKGTGMKLTINPDAEPNFYSEWPEMPPLDEGRVLPPLPPLPPEGIPRGNSKQSHAQIINGQGAHAGGNLMGGDTMMNVLQYGASAGISAFGDQMHQFGARHLNAGTVGLNPNDPIHDELSAMIRSRSQAQAVNAAVMASGMYPPQQLSYDRLLTERLRDLDRAQQIKKERQDINMLQHARFFDDLASNRVLPGSSGMLSTHVSGQPDMMNVNDLRQGPFNQFNYPPPQPASLTVPRGGEVPFSINQNDRVSESSASALSEGANNKLEGLVADRAMAQSLALAGALDVPTKHQPVSSSAVQKKAKASTPLVKESKGSEIRPSFGRPFGRKE